MPRVIAFVAVFGVALVLWLIMALTDTGKAIRAVAKEKLGSELAGIDVAHVYAMTFGLGTACVAIAACLLIPTYYANPHAGNAFMLVAFTIVVLGGMGSVPGALIGGLLIGVVESLAGFFFGESLGQVGIFLIFIARSAVPSARPVRSERMKGFLPIAVVVAALAAVPLIVHSNVVLNFLVVDADDRAGRTGLEHARRLWWAIFLRACRLLRHRRLCHRDVAGALWRQRLDWFAAGIAAGALVGAIIGGLAFRAGLRSSYFALVTLAFAEVLRIVASVAPITGAGVGLLVKLDLRAQSFQFQSRAIFYLVILALLAARW